MLNLGRASHDSAPHTDWDGYPTATMPWPLGPMVFSLGSWAKSSNKAAQHVMAVKTVVLHMSLQYNYSQSYKVKHLHYTDTYSIM